MAKSPNRSKKNMSNDALAALGLDVDTAADAPAAAPTEAPAAAVAVAAEVEAKASREEVETGEIEVGTLDFIPTMQRGGGAGGSKYKFAELNAPAVGADGKTKYSFFKVSLQPGVDADKLKRSVQSATTQENKKNKDRGSDAYYVTRTQDDPKTGEFAAILVIRTDVRPAKEEVAEAEQAS